MNQPIEKFEKDDLGDWMAILACGHTQHVRHNPPWINRPWVESGQGRIDAIGEILNCKKCDRGEPTDT